MNNSTFIFPNKRQNIILITGMVLAILLPFGLAFGFKFLNINYLDKVFYSEFIYWGTVLFLFFYASKIEGQPLLVWKDDESGIGFILLSVAVLYVAYIIITVVSAIPYWFGYQETDTLMRKVLHLLKGHPALIFFISI